MCPRIMSKSAVNTFWVIAIVGFLLVVHSDSQDTGSIVCDGNIEADDKESMVGYQVFKYCIEGVDSTSWDAVHWKIHKDEDLEDLYDKKSGTCRSPPSFGASVEQLMKGMLMASKMPNFARDYPDQRAYTAVFKTLLTKYVKSCNSEFYNQLSAMMASKLNEIFVDKHWDTLWAAARSQGCTIASIDVNENCKLSSIEMGMHFGGGMASKVTGNVKFDMSKVTGNVKFDKADQLTDLGFLRNVNSIEDLILVKCNRLTSLAGLEMLTTVSKLEIKDMDKLESGCALKSSLSSKSETIQDNSDSVGSSKEVYWPASFIKKQDFKEKNCNDENRDTCRSCGWVPTTKTTTTTTKTTTTTTKTLTTTTTATTTKTSTATTSTTVTATTTTTKTSTTTTSTTVTTTTTPTKTSTTRTPSDEDCVELQDDCTVDCQAASERNYRVLMVAVKEGKACLGASDCQPGDGQCPTTSSTATTTPNTITTTTITPQVNGSVSLQHDDHTSEGKADGKLPPSDRTNTDGVEGSSLVDGVDGAGEDGGGDDTNELLAAARKKKNGAAAVGAIVVIVVVLVAMAVMVWWVKRRNRGGDEVGEGATVLNATYNNPSFDTQSVVPARRPQQRLPPVDVEAGVLYLEPVALAQQLNVYDDATDGGSGGGGGGGGGAGNKRVSYLAPSEDQPAIYDDARAVDGGGGVAGNERVSYLAPSEDQPAIYDDARAAGLPSSANYDGFGINAPDGGGGGSNVYLAPSTLRRQSCDGPAESAQYAEATDAFDPLYAEADDNWGQPATAIVNGPGEVVYAVPMMAGATASPNGDTSSNYEYAGLEMHMATVSHAYGVDTAEYVEANVQLGVSVYDTALEHADDDGFC